MGIILNLSNYQLLVIFLVIFTTWTTTLYYRIFDRTIRNLIVSIGLCMIFWILIRIIKDFTNNKMINIYLWYLYYIPLLFMPALFYLVSKYMKNIKSKKEYIVPILVSFTLFLFVITNNFHNLVFKIENENNYTYGIMYLVICIWIFYIVIFAIKDLIEVGFNKKGIVKKILPFIPVLVGFIYTFLYVLKVDFIVKTNITIVLSSIFAIGIECMLRLTFIPNNLKYRKYYFESNLPMTILNNSFEKEFPTLSNIRIPEELKEELKLNSKNNITILQDKLKLQDKEYKINKITGGYAIFEKDLEKIEKLKQELKQKQIDLQNQEKILNKEKEVKEELFKMKLSNQILIDLEFHINNQKKIIYELINNKEKLSKEDLAYIKLLISYCKRMSMLIISNYNDETYYNSKIKLIIVELLKDFEEFNVNGACNIANIKITTNKMVSIYDIIFQLFERINDLELLINILTENNNVLLKILVSSNNKDRYKKIEENFNNKIDKEMLINKKINFTEDGLKIEIVI